MCPEAEKPESAQRFYDELASEYHLIFTDWRNSVNWQGEVLGSVIHNEVGRKPLTILDCSCGIGTQAIGLALRGYNITGTDISMEAIRRARREAKSFGVSIKFDVADFRDLSRKVSGFFDVVISCDNSLPHLLSDNDLEAAANSMWSKLKPNGIFLASIRDYDEILKERPKSTMPQVFDDANGKRIVFQIWDWMEDKPFYIFHQFILKESDDGWKVSRYSAQYRALYCQELTGILSKAGFSNIHWLMPDKTNYYQPIVIAFR